MVKRKRASIPALVLEVIARVYELAERRTQPWYIDRAVLDLGHASDSVDSSIYYAEVSGWLVGAGEPPKSVAITADGVGRLRRSASRARERVDFPLEGRTASSGSTVIGGVDRGCHDMRSGSWAARRLIWRKLLAASHPSPQRIVRRPRILPLAHTMRGRRRLVCDLHHPFADTI